jgi:hypothetical protein
VGNAGARHESIPDDFITILVSSIKGKVKKKNFSHGRNFSTFAAHLIEQDLF